MKDKTAELFVKKNECVNFRGGGYRTVPEYRRVVLATALLSDERVSPDRRVLKSLKLLLSGTSFFRAMMLSKDGRRGLLNEILNLLNFSSEKNESFEPRKQRLLSLEQDLELIRAAFLQAYGIDIVCDKLRWRDFISLLGNIPRCTKLFEVMSIRAVPEDCTGENAQRIEELKRIYSLKSPQEEFSDSLEKLFEKYAGG